MDAQKKKKGYLKKKMKNEITKKVEEEGPYKVHAGKKRDGNPLRGRVSERPATPFFPAFQRVRAGG